ncbi:YfcC family protein [Aminipila butyrica]|uniref:YfcC family protein n=1 Tax=Aminipila butyrica TaxID=433296 RepID=A0A858BY41_9FIRM|nr:YfcC family protein [Aminipila butyrica]QIB70035.1 YfcC family protein [Aminipila butyrica]
MEEKNVVGSGAPAKKKRQFPSAFTVLFIILIIAAIATNFMPTGTYSKLLYNADSNQFDITAPDGSVASMAADQQTLDELNIKAKLDLFLDGSIYKPIGIPGSYEAIDPNPQGFTDGVLALVNGVYDTIDISLFIFVLGGMLAYLNKSGAFSAGMGALSRATKGKEYILVILITFLISLGGTTFGMAEETVALYAVVIPIFVIAGYDALVGIAAVYFGSCIGTMCSTVNPFSAVIASNAAGINFMEGFQLRVAALIVGTVICILYVIRYGNMVRKNPEKSLILESKAYIDEKYCSEAEVPELTLRFKIILLQFFATFAIMVYGVVKLGWWFGEMTGLFLVSAIIMGLILRMSETEMVSEFLAGAGDMIGVALICGVARSINVILENGLVSDALLNTMSGWVEGMSPYVFAIVMYFIYIILGFFINSSSGLAVLSIPIMAPLADAVGLPREVVITAYMFGQGTMGFITPTGLVLVVLQLVRVNYDKYIKFVLPLMGILVVFSIAFLCVEVAMV